VCLFTLLNHLCKFHHLHKRLVAVQINHWLFTKRSSNMGSWTECIFCHG
jgi:hypothetical protein